MNSNNIIASKGSSGARKNSPPRDSNLGKSGSPSSGSGGSGSGSLVKKEQTAAIKPEAEHISDFQGEEDALHESQHELVEEPKQKSPKKTAEVEPVKVIKQPKAKEVVEEDQKEELKKSKVFKFYNKK